MPPGAMQIGGVHSRKFPNHSFFFKEIISCLQIHNTMFARLGRVVLSADGLTAPKIDHLITTLASPACQRASIPSLWVDTKPYASSRRHSVETHSTTVLCIRKDGEVVVVADGQVTMGSTVVKPNVRKTRKIGDQAIGGFAGATADAFTLFERLEGKLEEHPGQLTRAAVELAKMWRMDKYLRKLDVSEDIQDQQQQHHSYHEESIPFLNKVPLNST
jgi:hypothetical protein